MRRFILALACLLVTGSAAAEVEGTIVLNASTLTALLGQSSAATAEIAEIEKPAAINGTGYAIVSQLFDGSTGSNSYIRLINANNGNSTFNVLVINTANAITLGSAAIVVPPNAAPQYPLSGANSILSLAGVAPSAAANAAIYIQDSDVGAGYAHVTFNGATSLFENQSTCTTPLNQRLTSQNRQMLANVHTTALAGNNFPSIIGIHNYSTAAVSVRIAAYDAATGTSLGNTVQTLAANGTLTLPESQLESLIGFTPTSAQPHINLIVNHTSGAAAPVTLTQTIRNVSLGGEINMGQVCAVNSLSATTTTPVPVSTTPVAYCGTMRISTYPYSLINMGFTASIATNGRLRGTVYGEYAGTTAGTSFSGTVSGTRVSFDDTDPGEVVNVTAQNGVISGTIFNPTYGNATISASTSACS